ncbi:MAG: diphosphomevalonate/mevalonate 3,5-bisphosphate decarboxylase family protein [Bacteroidota bacterium]
MNDIFRTRLLEEAAGMKDVPRGEGICTKECPSNIAIVKYWGKYGEQKPRNPSLSLTLNNALTATSIHWETGKNIRPSVRFTFAGKESPVFAERIGKYLATLQPYLPFLSKSSLHINSVNTFPHSSGIASSASAFGSIALLLGEIADELYGKTGEEHFLRRASFFARLGSGSAARSIYRGMVLWGESSRYPGSSDEFAVPVQEVHQDFSDIRDSILIIDSSRKKVSSSVGHALMEDHPYALTRFGEADKNLGQLLEILKTGDWESFISLMEHEALSLHAMMMTARPGYLLMKGGTLSVLEEVQRFRKETGLPVGFTLDAGANVHLLYPPAVAIEIKKLTDSVLKAFCENGEVIEG